MTITLVIPTLRRYDLLDRCVSSACTGSCPPTHIHVIDNGATLPAHIRNSLEHHAALAGAQLLLSRPGRNLGVAASWNQGLHQAPGDWLIVSNDDVVFYHATIERLVVAAEAKPDALFWFPGAAGYKNAWSCFLQRAASLTEIGPYDEWISPGYGYFEDNDYSYRLQLAGHMHQPVRGCGYGHVESATIKALPADGMADHWRRFRLAENRYAQKWGGAPGAERYTIPFNGTPPDDYQRSRYEQGRSHFYPTGDVHE